MRKRIFTLACAASLALISSAYAAAGSQVVVPRGQAVHIVLANDLSGFATAYAPGIANAVQMAVAAHSSVRGFPIELGVVDAPCGNPAGDVAAAAGIVADARNVGVLGQLCSFGFEQALPLYESAGVVVISGSATNDFLPSYAPTVFNRTAVDDSAGFDTWYALVTALPSDLAWAQAYTLQFGIAPTPFADLYYDAASVLIQSLQRASSLDHGRLVIDRAALAEAVRSTTKFEGVTCTVTFDGATGNRVDDPTALAGCAS